MTYSDELTRGRESAIMSSLPNSRLTLNNQPVLRVRKQIVDFSKPNIHVFQAASTGSYASSRETTPSAEGSYLSAPSSITSVSSPVELHISHGSSLYAVESCGGSRASYQSDPIDHNSIESPHSESQRSMPEHRQYASLFPKPTNRDSNAQQSPTFHTSHEPVEDTDDEAENMDEYEEATEDEEDEDNDWSGEDGGLEALAISALGGDLAGAVSIIPALHRYMTSRIQRKVESWQNCAASGSHSSSGTGNNGVSSNAGQQSSPNNSRKRRRLEPDHGENNGGGEDEGNEGEGNEPPVDQVAPPGEVQQPMLACIFNKHDPIRYSATDKKYRTCAGPGFKNIQRLREHLKRTHSPVQCDRCYTIFPSNEKNRAAAMELLAAHRQTEEPCLRGDPALKEGISDAQWALLDGLNRKTNKYHSSHRTEKWIEIWKIVHPEQEPPTPWYENVIAETLSNRSVSSSQQIDGFVTICMSLMKHRLPDLVNAQGQLAMESDEILERILRQACKLWTGLNGNIPGSQSSSSLPSNNLSSLSGGSSTNITAPTAYTPGELMQASGSNTQPTFSNLNTNVTQSLAIEPQSNGRKRNLDTNQQHRFQPSMPAALSSGPGPNMQMAYMYESPEPWSMHNTLFMEPNNMGPHISMFPDQAWGAPNGQYHSAFPPGMPGDEPSYFQQAQGFDNGINMDEDSGNL